MVTKPGIATLLEAHAAGRKIFLVKGIPVSEDNNARYALRHFGAEWFNPSRSAVGGRQARSRMDATVTTRIHASSRSARERAYWDDTYDL